MKKVIEYKELMSIVYDWAKIKVDEAIYLRTLNDVTKTLKALPNELLEAITEELSVAYGIDSYYTAEVVFEVEE